jgi:bla regulator protein blaR1
MITTWMIYALVIGASLTAAAFVLERVTTTGRTATRFVWFGAILLSVAWPLGAVIRSLLPRSGDGSQLLPFAVRLQPMRVIAGAGDAHGVTVDRLLIGGWILLSALLLVRLARGMRTLRRTRAAWNEHRIDGATVRISDNVGPAVVGLRQMDVVIPDWVLALDAPLRAIVLRHEEEHRSARDPYLLFASAVATALMPWNPCLWIQAQRLRLAVEMDCDARVLRQHPSPERYGLLMLTIAQRRTIAPTLFAPMLSEPVTHLERRIKAMQNTPRLTRTTIVAGTVIAAAIVAFACSVQSDSPAAPKQNGSRALAPSGGPTPVNDRQTYFEFQVEHQAQPLANNPRPRYPDMLRSAHVEGEVLAQFVVDTTGRPVVSTLKVLKSTHDLFTNSVRLAVPMMKFSPALVGGKAVKQLVQMPFQFSLSHSSGATSSGVMIPQPGNARRLTAKPNP